MQNSLPEIRDEIADLKRQRVQVLAAPKPRAVIRERMRATLHAAAADEAETLQRSLRFHDRPGALRLRAPVVSVTGGDRADVTGLLAALLGPDALLKAMKPHFDALPDGPSDEERAARIADIDAALLALEHEEEDAVEALEESGAAVGRRADARPEVVLRVRADL